MFHEITKMSMGRKLGAPTVYYFRSMCDLALPNLYHDKIAQPFTFDEICYQGHKNTVPSCYHLERNSVYFCS